MDVIEPARTSRSRCRLCRNDIDEGALRFGVDNFSGFADGSESYSWYHLRCASRGVPKELSEALKKLKNRDDVEDYDGLLAQCLASAQRQNARYPYGERAATGRAKCVKCEQAIAKGDFRVAIEREIVTATFSTVGAGYLHVPCAVVQIVDVDVPRAVAINTTALSGDDLKALVKALEEARASLPPEGASEAPKAAAPAMPKGGAAKSLAAIGAAAQARDAASLVLADALMEKGDDPRGELIVIECALDGDDLPDARREELAFRKASIEPKALAAWKKALPFPEKTISLSRGLPEITIRAGKAGVDVEKVLANDFVRALVFEGATEKQLAAALKSPALGRMESLVFAAKHLGYGDAQGEHLAEALASSADVQSLRRLSFSRLQVRARGVFTLLGSMRLAALESIAFEYPGLLGKATSLARAAGLPALRTLKLDGAMLAPEGLDALVRSPIARRLATLSLDGVSGLNAFSVFDKAELPNLRALGLRGIFLSEANVAAMAKWTKALPNLVSLDLSGATNVGDAIVGLADPKVLPSLVELDLRDLNGRMKIPGVGPLGEKTRAALHARFGDRVLIDPPDEREAAAKKRGTKKAATKKGAAKKGAAKRGAKKRAR